jgi:hypothetical protein
MSEGLQVQIIEPRPEELRSNGRLNGRSTASVVFLSKEPSCPN